METREAGFAMLESAAGQLDPRTQIFTRTRFMPAILRLVSVYF